MGRLALTRRGHRSSLLTTFCIKITLREPNYLIRLNVRGRYKLTKMILCLHCWTRHLTITSDVRRQHLCRITMIAAGAQNDDRPGICASHKNCQNPNLLPRALAKKFSEGR